MARPGRRGRRRSCTLTCGRTRRRITVLLALRAARLRVMSVAPSGRHRALHGPIRRRRRCLRSRHCFRLGAAEWAACMSLARSTTGCTTRSRSLGSKIRLRSRCRLRDARRALGWAKVPRRCSSTIRGVKFGGHANRGWRTDSLKLASGCAGRRTREGRFPATPPIPQKTCKKAVF